MALCLEAQQDHEQRDDRYGHPENEERAPVGPQHPRQQDQRRDGGHHSGGQVASEVDVEGFDALCCHRGELARALAGQPRRPERDRPRQQLPAQRRGDARGGAVRCQLAQPCQRRPYEERAGQAGEQGDEPSEGPVGEKRTLDDHSEQDSLDHKAQSRRDPDGNGRREIAGRDSGSAGQTRIEESPQASRGRGQLVPLSVSGDSSRLAPVTGTSGPAAGCVGPDAPAAGSTGPGCAGRLRRPRKTQ